MAGTVEGGKKAAQTNKERYGKDFYKKVGAEGGKVGHTGGFYANPELARIAGRKGGSISKRKVRFGEYHGEILPIAEIARRENISYQTAYNNYAEIDIR